MKSKSRSASVALAAGAALALIVAVAPSASQAHSGTADEQAACTGDVLSLCFSEIPNEKRIVACLNRKLDKLSPACRQVIDPSPKSKRTRRKAN
ncbi:hypothetical protein [Hyphomicrobium methylovorum]|uniref:hypothetical protein n=1 Tax=Hyphomicrobium methylovorum TaxID=84 RepID=UPI001FEBD0EA|nr:hypothetical protein [Hyphomicrobium methylovorum]